MSKMLTWCKCKIEITSRGLGEPTNMLCFRQCPQEQAIAGPIIIICTYFTYGESLYENLYVMSISDVSDRV
jgi:hypothetical protein